jgi:SAM-dependent methyltransferase
MRRLALSLALLAASAAGQNTPPAEAPAAEPSVLETLRAEAAAMRPLVQSSLALAFLQATAALPEVQPRTVFSNADRSRWYTAQQAAALTAGERAALTERALDASFYWNTRYGTPVAYARALDLAAQRMAPAPGAFSTMVDFGCGGLGADRMVASLGHDVVGIDVDPLLPALYSEPGDTGAIPGSAPGSTGGTLTLVTGQWPGEPAVADAVRAALPQGVDLFLSKNTLKHGYLHPAEPVDPRRLVHLGVSDEEFLAAVVAALRPGGLFMIYNVCPAPAAAGEPYIPWADGHCPFPREMLEAAGLQVLDFDVVDDEAVRAMGHALGWDEGRDAMDLENDLFAWFTVARRPAAGPK